MSSNRRPAILQRFAALSLAEGLTNKKSKRYRERRRQFITEEVNAGFLAAFGSNAGSLNAWRDLCYTVGIRGSNDLTNIEECKNALDGKFVNIVDLVDAGSEKRVMKRGVFHRGNALSEYTKREEKFYPLEEAKANPLLRQFLVKI